MARTDNDTWDLASSVGVTATMVAASRAMATKAERPLINDPFAEPLVRAVGVDVFVRLASGELTPADFGADGDGRPAGPQRMTENMAVRTKFYDEFFLDATEAGIRQAVILASGLDCRAYRLAWPAGTTVYEIDQPQVIEFKSRTLAELGAQPTAQLRTVATDLRYDWPTALRAAGFDPGQPTAWSAEGLLGYLPPEAQDRLLDTVTALSASGSAIATESLPRRDDALRERLKEHFRTTAELWRKHGLDLDVTELVYFGDRNQAASYLSDRGWQMTGSSTRELFAANGLPPLDDDFPLADRRYVVGTLTDKKEEPSPVTPSQPGRFDGDSWDPASSVGATATMVAASRALASQGPDPLLDDPLADPLVRAVGVTPFIRLIDGEVDLEDDPALNRRTRIEQMAVRTRYFDSFFVTATEAGIRQAVILASGLDTRAYRLPWPAGTMVYEIDQPLVIDFKTNTLADLGANPTAERRTVSIDLREDWPTALRQQGFDVEQPTAWSAEGLLPYLPPEAQDRLFDNITALSAPGSQLATEHISDPDAFSEEGLQRVSERWRRAGFDVNAADLFYQGERSIVIDYLTGHGWQVAAYPAPELYERNGFTFPEDDSVAWLRQMSYVIATLG
ncbi:MAG: class I SAM-dependent methyltransferase [Mycobacterium sp.]|nr:class I SAM-dependent methyltransferase [Mycobacterium sp.]